MPRLISTLLLCATFFIAIPAAAIDMAPFSVRNLSPTALVHGLPIAETPHLLPAGEIALSAGFELANHATVSDRDNEAVILDGETYITTLGLRYGLNEKLQVGFDLPWIKHADGFMDGFIDDWHSFFSLPNGDRDELKNNQLAYSYQRNSAELMSLEDETDGIGDLRLHLVWQFKTTSQSAWTLQTQLKAPTGDAGELTGSDAWDLSLALATQHDYSSKHGQFSIWGGLGFSWLGNGDVIADEVENHATNGWLGAGWSPLDWLALKLQVDSHTALYDSNLTELGDPAVILTMGGTLALSEKTQLEIGVGEDLNVSASPDVTLHLNLAHRF